MGYVEVKLLLSRIQNVCVAGWRTPVWLWILLLRDKNLIKSLNAYLGILRSFRMFFTMLRALS
jgi:hypothetical protein